MNLPVWMYWEGAMPAWIEATAATVPPHAADVRLLTRADFDRLWTRDRDLDLDRLYVAHRADFIRLYVLAHYGGLWIDADCVVIRPLQPVLDALDTWDFVGYKERQGHVANNFMAARPGSRLAAAVYRRACATLRAGAPLSWLALGSDALSATVAEEGVPWLRLGYELVQPICWSYPDAFFAVADPAAHARGFNERSLCYMLSNHMVQGYQAAHPGADLLAAGTFFRYLLERAAGDAPPGAPQRRSSMGSSNWQQIPFCVEALLDVCPLRVLDVGIGFGRWGMLVREFGEEWKGRIHRENWRVHLEGIEAYPRNVEEYHHLFYDWVHVGDGAAILANMQERWDLIIFGDVLEHWARPESEAVLERALALADYVLVNIPLGPGWERGPMYDNPYEEHRSFWELDEFLARGPVRHAVFAEYSGRAYGAFLLSHDDPRGLRR